MLSDCVCESFSRITTLTLQWRHNEHDCVSNYQHLDCLFNSLFRRRSKEISKPRVTGLCVGNSPVTGEFPAQRASNAENVSIWWRHHEQQHFEALPNGRLVTNDMCKLILPNESFLILISISLVCSKGSNWQYLNRFRYWFNFARQQTITWTCDDNNPWRHMGVTTSHWVNRLPLIWSRI